MIPALLKRGQGFLIHKNANLNLILLNKLVL